MEPEQRWRRRKTRWVRPDRPIFDPTGHSVRRIPWMSARDFLVEHHYSASYPQISVPHGLIDPRGRLVGVATFGISAGGKTMRKWLVGQPGLELNRFVLLDEVAFNAETWFLGRSFDLLEQEKPKLRAVFAMSDPHPRTDIEGDVVMPGHVGQIYQGHNARLIGLSDPKELYLDDFGRTISDRASSKLGKERGGGVDADGNPTGKGFYRRFLDLGAPPRRRGEPPRSYMRRALEEGPFRPFQHPGNYVYLWDSFGPKRERRWFDELAQKVEEVRFAVVLGDHDDRVKRLAAELGVPDWMPPKMLEVRAKNRKREKKGKKPKPIPGPAEFALVPLPFPRRRGGVTGSSRFDASVLSRT